MSTARPQSRYASRFLLAGLWLAVVEVALVMSSERGLFLSASELRRYAVFALTALPAACAILGWLGVWLLRSLTQHASPDSSRFGRRLALAFSVTVLPLCGAALWSLTSGRRVRDLSLRPVMVSVLAAMLAFGLFRVVLALIRLREREPHRLRVLVPLLVLAVGGLMLDMYGLRRLYPALHGLLAATSVGAALVACTFAPIERLSRGWLGGIWLPLALVLAAWSLHDVRSLLAAPNARFAITQAAPLSGKLLRLARISRTAASAVPGADTTASMSRAKSAVEKAGIDLRGRDVLMITVDALRADRLRAYGGSGLTPGMDELAKESVVFQHAYTPTPHTSYAISSLMTAKPMRPLLALADAKGHHPTLAEMLRQHGYRTAAFYPPAIFFVDQERFGSFASQHLGFEYVKDMFASAQQRVPQLEAYLRGVDLGHPVFVWLHIFEPHEPYEPPTAFVRGDTPVLRYDGEVAAADAAVRDLIAAFRKSRPGATVILTADHGEEFGEHGGHHHGTTLFDEQIRVPLLWSSPGQTKPHNVDAPVELIDLTTSLLSALGIPREARMRGDDLGSLLAGGVTRDGMHAFASLDLARMVTDGRMKLICAEAECQLFDLLHDPSERIDLVDDDQEPVVRLRTELAKFVASVPRIESLAMHGGGAWPQALARARLGDASAVPELVPLLSSARAEVRAAAARALGELGARSAGTVLANLCVGDPDAEVMAEAAIACLRIGGESTREQVAGLLLSTQSRDRALRAALALAARRDARGEGVLLSAAADDKLDETERLSAIRALATVGGKAASVGLIPLLSNVRLRPEVVAALGQVGDRHAVTALVGALKHERYPEARRAEVQALLLLGAHKQALSQARRFLGTESSIPDGVSALLQAGVLTPASGGGADLRAASDVRHGPWSCEARGCRPHAGATIVLPARGAPPGSAKAVLRVAVVGTSRLLRFGGKAHYLNGGASEIAIDVERARDFVFEVQADEGVLLQALAVVPVQDDIPAPPPEPWTDTEPPPQ